MILLLPPDSYIVDKVIAANHSKMNSQSRVAQSDFLKSDWAVLMTTFAALIFVAPGLQRVGHTHCDTMDGPVIADAKKALGAGDVTPVLKW